MSQGSSSASTVVNLSPTEFTQLPDAPFLIDVRSALEFRAGHAPTAQNLSLPRILLGLGGWRWLLPKWFQQLSRDQPIAVVCLTAHRSPIAAKQLAKVGFMTVYNVTGGMMEWRRQGLTTEVKSTVSSSR